MNKFKMLSLSLVAAMSFGVSANFSSVQAAESLVPEVFVTSDTFWYSTDVQSTSKSMWVSVAHNGKIYSGYIYNRGYSVGKPGHYLFSGTLRVGPYAPTTIVEPEEL
ncbi:hypothetical protein P9B03_08075 [Metasolibacillus meyeri]|uniref:Uncharacterized protein n=1 Tax=Metasolibacillus meyeri TaxID=1071052 RepID=A0AAW9NV75_9BACL|nr:hypothetical protein [Metasolibacillus meyeri]MEC1178435.1 hypothetical protein [Metasolibacillus meyeri]